MQARHRSTGLRLSGSACMPSCTVSVALNSPNQLSDRSRSIWSSIPCSRIEQNAVTGIHLDEVLRLSSMLFIDTVSQCLIDRCLMSTSNLHLEQKYRKQMEAGFAIQKPGFVNKAKTIVQRRSSKDNPLWRAVALVQNGSSKSGSLFPTSQIHGLLGLLQFALNMPLNMPLFDIVRHCSTLFDIVRHCSTCLSMSL